MKNLLLLLFLILCSFAVKAQQYSICEPGLTPWDAPLLTCGLEGYSYHTDQPNAQVVPPGFCGDIDNNQWLAFVAGSDNIILEIDGSSCFGTPSGSGLQMQMFFMPDGGQCGDQNYLVPASDCMSNAGQLSGTIIASGLEVNRVYFLMIDGWDGDICDYTLHVLVGSTTKDCPIQQPYIDGPTTVAEGSIANYTLVIPPDTCNSSCIINPCNNQCCSTCADTCNPVNPYANWTAPPGSTIVNISPDGLTATIIFGPVGGQVCASVGSSCGGADACIDVVVIPNMPPTIVDATICEGDCYAFCNSQYCSPGSYPCQMIGPSGQMEFFILNLSVTPTPNATIDNVPPIACVGQPIPFFASGANTFAWATNEGIILDGQGTGVANILFTQPGIAQVCATPTDACPGPPACTTIQVFDNLFPPSIFGVSDVLEGEQATYSTPAQPGAIDYIWTVQGGVISNGQGTPFVDIVWGPMGAGTVCVTILNPCQSFGPECIDVTINAPVLLAPILSGNPGLCEGQPGNFQAFSADGATQFNWSINGGSIVSGQGSAIVVVVPNGPGSMQVCAIAQINGNSSPSACLTVPVQSAPNAGTPLVLDIHRCQGVASQVSLSAQLSGADAGGLWKEVSAIPSTGGAFNAISATFQSGSQAPGLYRFLYIVSGSGFCAPDTAELHVVVDQAPDADAGPDTNIPCDGQSLIGTDPGSTANLTFTWTLQGQPAGSEPQIPVNTAGVYQFTVLNTATGCSKTDETTVTVAPSITNVQTDITQPSCNGDDNGQINVGTVTGGTPPYQYALGNGTFGTGVSFPNLPAGTYVLHILDGGGCTWENSVTVNQPAPLTLSLGDDQLIQVGSSAHISAQTNIPNGTIQSIAWSAIPGDSILCNNCPYLDITPIETGQYQALLTDLNGCSVSDQLTVFVEQSAKIFAPNAFTPDNNGVNDKWVIHASSSVLRIRDIRVFDRWGGLVYQEAEIPSGSQTAGWDGNYKGRPLPSGVYVYTAIIEYPNGKTERVQGDITLMR